MRCAVSGDCRVTLAAFVSPKLGEAARISLKHHASAFPFTMVALSSSGQGNAQMRPTPIPAPAECPVRSDVANHPRILPPPSQALKLRTLDRPPFFPTWTASYPASRRALRVLVETPTSPRNLISFSQGKSELLLWQVRPHTGGIAGHLQIPGQDTL